MKKAIALIFLIGAEILYGQTPVISSVVDSETYDGATPRLSPGAVASIFGSHFGTSKSIPVTVAGKAAYLYAVTDGQINMQVPVDAPVGKVPVVVGNSAPFNINLAQYAPAIVSANHIGTGPVAIVGASQGPFKAGDEFAVYASGLGPTTPPVATGEAGPNPPANTAAKVTATIGGMNAVVDVAVAAPGQVGFYQVNIVVPPGLYTGDQYLAITVGGVSSQPNLTVPITGTTPPVPTISSVVDAVSGGSKVAPQSLIAVFGSNFASTADVAVTVGGKKAFVFYVSNTQVNVEIPVDAPLGATTLQLNNSTPFPITLLQFAPALYTGPASSTNVLAQHPNGSRVNSANPAAPSETISIFAAGLGPTNPVVATGVTPNSPVPTTAAPVVIIGGQAATVVASALVDYGVYQVTIVVPPNLTAGTQNLSISIGGVASPANPTVTIPIAIIPLVSAVVNAASGILPGLPNAGIAQGSIFLVVGANLGPAALSTDSALFQHTSLSGTSIAVKIGGQTVNPLFYYTSSGQLAALMPSNTPAGTGTMTVTYNGQNGSSVPVTVVPNNLGIFTITSNGQGAAIVTNADYSLISQSRAANCGGPFTTCGAANPGDTLILWTTGLGPVSAPDQSGPQPGNMSNIPLTLWVGGVQANVTYQGRSGCCIGEDQIVFTVPANAPTGCAVPLVAQIGNQISNNTFMAIAPAGSRTCTPTNPAYTPAVVTVLSGSAPVTVAPVNLKRKPNNNATAYSDNAKVQFLQFTVPTALQPFALSYLDTEPVGTCMVYNALKTGFSAPFSFVGLDAGAKISITGPNGAQSFGPSFTGEYDATLSATGNYLAPGSYVVSGPGGADVGNFSVPFTIPTLPAWTNQNSVGTVNRANGLTITWSGGDPNFYVAIEGFSATDKSQSNGASFNCLAAASAGTFTVPAPVLEGLPAGSNAVLYFEPIMTPVSFTATGLSFGFVEVNLLTAAPVTFQ